MKQGYLQICLGTSVALTICLISKPLTAQIVPDGTLPVNSVVTPLSNTNLIQGGTVRGSNLFHSFKEFSILNGNTAYFNNSLDITNIFTRVTGGSISNINGVIKANGIANLFLINPNGIVFGNARLDIGGSFIGTSASSIKFGDGFEFSAKNPQSSPLLSINVPTGLQFARNPGSISGTTNSTENVGLSVPSGATLALIGGEIAVDGGNLTVLGGRIELGAVTGNSQVSLTPTNPGWKLGYENISNFENIYLTNATISSNSNGRGSIAITGNNIDILSSTIQAGINAGFQLDNQPGDITLNSQGNIIVRSSTIANQVHSVGNAGNIDLKARSLFFSNGTEVVTNNLGEGNAGNITINAKDTISLDEVGKQNPTVISANLFGSRGNGGKITANATNVSLKNGATIVAHTLGQGNAGSIEINASDRINIDGLGSNGFTSGVGSQVFPEAVGNGGEVILSAPTVTLSGGAAVVAHTLGRGNAGTVNINAQKVFLDGLASNGESSGLGSAAFTSARGNAGKIAINTNSLSVTNSASLFVATFGQGDAGSITINATGDVTFDGVGANGRSSNAFSTVERESVGNGKEINITADTLTIKNGAVVGTTTRGVGKGSNINIKVNNLQVQGGGQIVSTSRSSGDAGDIAIAASRGINLSGSDPNFLARLARIGRPVLRNQGAASGLYADTDEESTAKGGNINISTRNFSISNGAIVDASALGQGSTGDIKISAENSLFLNESTIAALSIFGKGGNIDLQIARGLVLRNQSSILTRAGTEASGGGDGGNIAIATGALAAVKNSNINANAFQGRGGNIQISTLGLFLAPNSTITASSQRGINGNIQINTPDIDPTSGLLELPNDFSDRSNLIVQGCPASKDNSFTITGRGGLPTNPQELMRSNETATIDWVTVQTQTEQATKLTSNHIEQSTTPNQIIEANNLVVNKLGEVTLTASTANTVHQSGFISTPKCAFGTNGR